LRDQLRLGVMLEPMIVDPGGPRQPKPNDPSNMSGAFRRSYAERQ
jgi:hypothetical protein